MEPSILVSIKLMLGLEADYNAFDVDIITHINSAFMYLHQLGVGPTTAFSIEDGTKTWSDFTPDIDLAAVKTYIYLRVRVVFDPPQTSFVLEALKSAITEMEWRLNIQSERPPSVPVIG